MKNFIEKRIPKIETEINNLLENDIDREWVRENIYAGESWQFDKNLGVDFEFDFEVWKKSVMAPMKRILKSGGKRLRPILTILMHEIFKGENREIYKLAVIPEVVHNATLMVDDIEDNSTLRRGSKCAHLKYGVPIAVNDANFFYFYPLGILDQIKCTCEQKNTLYSVYHHKMMQLHIGQAMDIQWAVLNEFQRVTRGQYLQMCAYKTGGLLSIAMQFGAIVAGANGEILQKIDEIAIKMGLAYQIKDDILNISENGEWGKEFGEDITEAKMTLLVIESLEKTGSKDRQKLINILSKKTKEKDRIIEAIEIMDGCGAIKEAEVLAFNLIDECKNDLVKYFPNNDNTMVLDEMLDYLIDRKK